MKHIIKHRSTNSKEGSHSTIFMKKLRAFFSLFDYLQIVSILLLLSFGIIFIYSAGQQVGGAMRTDWEKQIIWAVLGICVWILICIINYRTLGIISPILYIISIILLILVVTHGTTFYGAKRWISFGGFTIQPSEFAKISTLLFASWIASLKNFKINRLTHLLGLLIIIGLPFILVLRQPDLATSLVFIIILATVAFSAKISWKWIIAVLIIVFVAAPAMYPFLKPYQKERILVFLDSERDPLNQGWTSRQTLLSVGSGGLYGKGLMNGTQNMLGFLPKSVSNSDLIFSVIAEESGFAGACTLLLFYLMLIYSILRTAFISKDNFGYILSVTVAVMLVEHIFVNIGMNVRLMPITGLPLPLISYGGSFILTSLISLGLVQSVYINRLKKEELDSAYIN